LHVSIAVCNILSEGIKRREEALPEWERGACLLLL